MATYMEYAEIAHQVYHTDFTELPPEQISRWLQVNNFALREMRKGSRFDPQGYGVQFGKYESGLEVIVAFCGTNTENDWGKGWSDLVNDLDIGLGLIPNQIFPAVEYTRAVASLLTANQRLSLTGHSLGGALAQLVGANQGLPFVTFGAPGSKHLLPLITANPPASAVNFTAWGDMVTWVGQAHVGQVISMTKGGAWTFPTTHYMPNYKTLLAREGWASRRFMF
ncbi:MAG: hypothetical protein ACFCBW_15795 [Candidatus Competibacterales bacterium]